MLKRLFLVFILLFLPWLVADPEVYLDVEGYGDRLADPVSGDGHPWYKWGVDETIWPEEIREGMEVLDYKMVRYDPWDAQFLGYLTVRYGAEAYEAETARLAAYPSSEYLGYYGVTGPGDLPLLAIWADPYYGFVYALAEGEDAIVYAEEIFCNYFLDLDPREYIPENYLLEGFDAGPKNPYRQRMMKERGTSAEAAR